MALLVSVYFRKIVQIAFSLQGRDPCGPRGAWAQGQLGRFCKEPAKRRKALGRIAGDAPQLPHRSRRFCRDQVPRGRKAVSDSGGTDPPGRLFLVSNTMQCTQAEKSCLNFQKHFDIFLKCSSEILAN